VLLAAGLGFSFITPLFIISPISSSTQGRLSSDADSEFQQFFRYSVTGNFGKTDNTSQSRALSTPKENTVDVFSCRQNPTFNYELRK